MPHPLAPSSTKRIKEGKWEKRPRLALNSFISKNNYLKDVIGKGEGF